MNSANTNRTTFFSSFHWLSFLFLLSGVSALIYQIVWQRALFTIFGTDIESVTIIIAIFMFGLGIGAVIGGAIQHRYSASLLTIFCIFEILIGLYGLMSISFISIASGITITSSMPLLCIVVFLLLAIPTLLMGATLPVLVAYLNQYFHHIGKSLTILYAFNTFGAGVAAFLTVEVFFTHFGQKMTLMIAALCNMVTAYLIYEFGKRIKQNPPSYAVSMGENSITTYLPYGLVLVLAGVIGYITLSQEILWYRTIGYMTANKPQVFGFVLAAFLIGIAVASFKLKDIDTKSDIYHYLIRTLIIASIFYYIAFPVIGFSAQMLGKEYGLSFSYLAIEYVAFLTGGVFPILMHIGIHNNSKAASAVSLVYCCNIMGSILGPLVTGFIFLEYFSLKQNILIILVLTIVFTGVIIIISPFLKIIKYKLLAGLAVLTVTIMLSQGVLYQHILEAMLYGDVHNTPFKTTIENRNGIITVQGMQHGDDVIFGNGIYDGRINSDPVLNSNNITRVYMIAAMHRNPQRILEIGLSGGSGTKVLTSYTSIKELTVVEINKGYMDLVARYPQNISILHDKRTKIVVDDARRWLRRNLNDKFDMIIMNSTYHWRNYSTNLLSREFLELCKTHLNKDGIIYYNTTGSKDVIYTAAHVFSYVSQYGNFVAASDTPLALSAQVKKENFLKFIDDSGIPIFKRKDPRYGQLLTKLVQYKFPSLHDTILKQNDLWLITDDNMATEYKNR